MQPTKAISHKDCIFFQNFILFFLFLLNFFVNIWIVS